MATLKSTIILQDKMTSTLKSVLHHMQSTINTMDKVDKSSELVFNQMKASIGSADAALDKFNNDLRKLPDNAERGKRAINGFNNPFVTLAGTIYTIRSAIQGLSGVTNAVDTFISSKSRIDLINTGLETTEHIQDKIFASAKRARADYTATAGAISKMGILAGDAFKNIKGKINTDEIIAFTELMNKSFRVGGAAPEERAAAIYQLTQAMASNRLQGDEMRTIRESAPLLIKAISDFTGKSGEDLMEMAEKGEITAKIIKGALFSVADETEEKFSKLPVTFGDIWTDVKNRTLQAFRPVMTRIIELINTEDFKKFTNNLISGIYTVGMWFVWLLDIIVKVVNWIATNWPIIKEIVIDSLYGIAAAYTAAKIAAFLFAIANGAVTLSMIGLYASLLLAAGLIAGAVWLWNNFGIVGKILAVTLGVLAAVILIATISQWAFNVSLYACPIVWIIALIIALIAIIVVLVLWIMDLWKKNMDFKYGVIAIWNSILNFFDKIPVFFQWVGNGIADAFAGAKLLVLTILQAMANEVINIINNLIGMLNKIPGVSIEPLSQLTFATEAAAEEFAAKQARDANLQASMDAVAQKAAERDAKMAEDRANDEARIAAEKAAAEEAAKKNDQQSGIPGMEPFDFSKFNIDGGYLDSIGKIDEDVGITDEDIKLLKDIAATEFVNKYTTLRPEMKVTFGDVKETADVNKIMAVIEDMVEEAYASSLVGEGA